jgi:hypothetical protein
LLRSDVAIIVLGFFFFFFSFSFTHTHTHFLSIRTWVVSRSIDRSINPSIPAFVRLCFDSTPLSIDSIQHTDRHQESMPPQHHHQHHHSPPQNAARLTFRRAPSFSSPTGPLMGGTSSSATLSSLSPMATLRGFFGGGGGSSSTSTSSTAAGARRSTSSAHHHRSMHVGGFEDEEDDGADGRAAGAALYEDEGIIPLKMTLGRFNGAGGRTRMVFTDEGWQIGACERARERAQAIDQSSRQFISRSHEWHTVYLDRFVAGT